MGKIVMIVDDAVSIRGLASMTLENAGYQVVEARDGKEALEKLSQNKVNMLITDINMPNMNGIDLIKVLKSDVRYKHLPVVILTKETEPEMKEKARTSGVRAWINKPFKPNTILKVVQKVIGS